MLTNDTNSVLPVRTDKLLINNVWHEFVIIPVATIERKRFQEMVSCPHYWQTEMVHTPTSRNVIFNQSQFIKSALHPLPPNVVYLVVCGLVSLATSYISRRRTKKYLGDYIVGAIAYCYYMVQEPTLPACFAAITS